MITIKQKSNQITSLGFGEQYLKDMRNSWKWAKEFYIKNIQTVNKKNKQNKKTWEKTFVIKAN